MSDSLEELRDEIDKIDKTIVEQLDRRARVVKKIGEIKHEKGIDLYVPGREREILNRLEKIGSGDFPSQSLRLVFREIITTCLNLEKPVTIGYLGPESTFTHSAALKRFGHSTDLKPLKTVSDVFYEVETDEVDYGLVPVENSSEGAVRHTLDRFLQSDLSICSECYLRIELCLLSKSNELNQIEKLYSHGQAFSQAKEWVERTLPEVEITETNSTAEAARLSANNTNAASIASESAAEVYDLNILASNLEKPDINYTRFLVIGKESPAPSANDKTTVAFSLKDKAGALHEILEPFGRLDINMTKIESRPSPKKTWDYIFFVDFEGHKDDTTVQELLDELRAKSSLFKILGSYPQEKSFE